MMRRRVLEWGLMAGLILPAGVSVQYVPKGASLNGAVHEAGIGHRFEKTENAKFRGVERPRWKRSFMLGHGGPGFGAFEWVHEEIVAVPGSRKKGGYFLYKFRTTSFDPVLRGEDREPWDAFLSKGKKVPSRK